MDMARVTEVRLIDDIDGGEAEESIEFTLDGKAFEIDLNAKHAAELRDALAPFVGAARRAGGGSAVARPKSYARSGRSREETAAIREWASANGYEVAPRGRIPSAVIQAYENRGAASVVDAAPGRRPRRRPTSEPGVTEGPGRSPRPLAVPATGVLVETRPSVV
jgi:hypothetical protein